MPKSQLDQTLFSSVYFLESEAMKRLKQIGETVLLLGAIALWFYACSPSSDEHCEMRGPGGMLYCE